MCCIMGYAGHDLPKETFTEYLLRTTSRGPDDQRVAETEFGLLGFGRLAIMGLTPEGMQPFFRGADCVACNGELYGFRPVKAELEAEGYTFESDSDCEIILPLYYKYGLDMFKHLDAEFAMILYDSRKKLLIAARDHGVLINVTRGTTIRLLPPLTLDEREVEMIVRGVSRALEALPVLA